MDDVKVGVTLPATVEEYHRALRTAFRAGARWEQHERHSFTASAIDEACRRYPIRKKVPRRVALNPEFETIAFVDVSGALNFEHYRTGEPQDKCRLSPESVAVLRDLLANPYETVEE